MSDAKLKAKVALQMSGVISHPAANTQTKANAAPAGTERRDDREPVGAALAHADIERDAQKSSSAAIDAANGHQHPIERVLAQPATCVSDEGTNLLADEQTSPAPGPQAEKMGSGIHQKTS